MAGHTSVPTTAAMSAATGMGEVRGAAGTATAAAVTEGRGAAAGTTARQPAEVATQTAAATMMRPHRVVDRGMGAATTIAAAMVAGAPSCCVCCNCWKQSIIQARCQDLLSMMFGPAYRLC